MVTFTTYCKVYNVRNLAVTDIVWLKDVCYQNQWSKTITADADAKMMYIVSHFQLLIRKVVLVRS